MPTANIVITLGVLGGKPHIEGRRISVQQVAEYHTDLGWTSEEIAEALNLTPAEVHAALSYYYAHKDEIDSAIREAELQLQGAPTVQDVIEGRYKLIMTVSEVAEAYGISDRTVREAIEKGWLNAQKSGGTWLIRRRDAQARWGHRGQQKPKQPARTPPDRQPARNPAIWVTPHAGRWAVRKTGSQRASRIVDTQREAIDIGKRLAERRGTD